MEFLYGLGFVLLFGLSAIGGMALSRRLPQEHLSTENMEVVRLVTGLLVTFAAVVLSLQLSTTRSAFDSANKDRTLYAAHLTRLDQCQRNLGPELEPARLLLRQYTAAVIASTWPQEAPPSVAGMPDTSRMSMRGEDGSLSAIMNRIGLAIDSVTPAEGARANIAARCREEFGNVQKARWAVIEDAQGSNHRLFVAVITFWLILVFLSFGLQIPRRLLTAIVLAIGVVSVASVMFVIVDLSLPYGGLFGITSSAMREALADMSR